MLQFEASLFWFAISLVSNLIVFNRTWIMQLDFVMNGKKPKKLAVSQIKYLDLKWRKRKT